MITKKAPNRVKKLAPFLLALISVFLYTCKDAKDVDKIVGVFEFKHEETSDITTYNITHIKENIYGLKITQSNGQVVYSEGNYNAQERILSLDTKSLSFNMQFSTDYYSAWLIEYPEDGKIYRK